MRTKNRSVLLKRALESVLAQSFVNWRMVIVNDGGDPTAVEFLVRRYEEVAGNRIRIVHNATSLGMEGASKTGLDALGDTDLLVIHDDDDSWSPEFLTVTISELRQIQQKYPTVQGVVTYANRVLERVRGQIVETESVAPFNEWVKPGFLSLDRMLLSNFIPPISFLFTRAAYDDVGGIYEAVPYLGDWDFLVRVMTKYDVYLIPQYLAFYHWRVGPESAWLGNSIIDELSSHRSVRQLLLNQWLRADLAAGRFGVGAYANLRAHIETLVHQGEELVSRKPETPVSIVREHTLAAVPVAAPIAAPIESDDGPVRRLLRAANGIARRALRQ